MIRDQRGASILEYAAALVLVGIVTLGVVNMTDVTRNARQTDTVSYASAVASSVVASIQAQPYSTEGYDVTGPDVINPKGWDIRVTVEYYQDSAIPVWDAAYPDTGLQRIRVAVHDFAGDQRGAVEFFKWRSKALPGLGGGAGAP